MRKDQLWSGIFLALWSIPLAWHLSLLTVKPRVYAFKFKCCIAFQIIVHLSSVVILFSSYWKIPWSYCYSGYPFCLCCENSVDILKFLQSDRILWSFCIYPQIQQFVSWYFALLFCFTVLKIDVQISLFISRIILNSFLSLVSRFSSAFKLN